MIDFSTYLIHWQKQHGRHDLPWQVRDPYRIWLSEIMLQQTQVATVLDYYPRFVAAFPTVYDLAAAHQDEVLRLWAGLGYYSRARNLHFAAQQIVYDFGGQFPTQRIELEKLKGVGRSTAAAIAAFAFHQRETILDGNVKRVLCRVLALDGEATNKAFERQLWASAEQLLPQNQTDMPAYTQGLMDLGATVCTRSKPKCETCPMHTICQAKAQNRVHELPRKKTAITVKNQTLYWAIIQRQDGAIWLQKRANRGIWANLYCVPTFENLAQLPDILDISYADALPELTHRLTHRLLQIVPYHWTHFADDLTDCDGQWMLPSQRTQFGLPKPLSELIHKICA